MLPMKISAWLFALSFFSFIHLAAQDKFVTVEGFVKPGDTNPTVVKIHVSKSGKNKKTYTSKPDGKYKLELDFQAVFDLEFDLDGYVIRKFSIDTKVPKEIFEEGVMPVFLDVLIYKPFDQMPNETGKIKFDDREYAFILEQEHLRTLKAQQKKVESIKSGNDEKLALLEEEKKRKAEEARLKKEAEDKRLKEEEEARLKKEAEDKRIRDEIERLRKLNNIVIFPTEEDRLNVLKNGERAALTSKTYIILKAYDTLELIGSTYYGFVNFGAGGGNIEITKEEFDRYRIMFNK